MRRRALVFAAPERVEVVEEACPEPGPGEVLVEARLSAVSAGTELTAYRGLLPADLPVDETLGAFAGAAFAFPFRFGYASLGVARGLGAGVDARWRGQRVFAFVPHASAFVAPVADVFAVPDGLCDEAAVLYASAETAVNLVLDGRPQLGERVAVFGQGVIGLLTTGLLSTFPLETLCAVEPSETRAALARRMGAPVVARDAAEAARALGGADLTYELTGQPAALDGAIAVTGREGRVVVGSFYGDKRAPVDLGGHFHRGRLTVISSQVSHLAPALGGRWDRARRRAAAFRALAALEPRLGALISHRVPLADAARAYRLLAQGDPAALQVLLVHDKEAA